MQFSKWTTPLLGGEQEQFTKTTHPRGVLVSVNFGCFAPSRGEHYHCNNMGKAIKACMNWNKIQQIEYTPVQDGQTPIPMHKPHDRNSDNPGCRATADVTCDAE